MNQESRGLKPWGVSNRELEKLPPALPLLGPEMTGKRTASGNHLEWHGFRHAAMAL